MQASRSLSIASMFNSQARQTATGANPVKSPSAPSQVPANLYSSAAAAGSSGGCDIDMYTVIDQSRSLQAPPTLDMLASLRAVPGALASRGRGGRTKASSKLVREGQIVSKLFDNAAGRPQPRNGISLEQGITLEFAVTLPAYFASSATSGIPTYSSSVISLNQFTAPSTLLTVFDQYRFEQVEAWIECDAPNGTAAPPELYSAVDLDDGNAPTSLAKVQDHQGAIISGGLAGHYHKWKPHVAVAAFSGAFTSYANEPAMWIDAASPGVEHYALKLATLSKGGSFSYTVVLRAVVSFRAPSIN